ncbi:hypothetical protein BYT27DRAFT_7250030 [Phlegmacium glaucopus]|nr:hypothetical protein BYT27DRAFT_7250030 [Phlegmacium glaucopus]
MATILSKNWAYKPLAPAKVQLGYLSHTQEQKAATASLYERKEISSYNFDPTNLQSQANAQQVLLQLGLGRTARDWLDSRWSVQWSNSWSIGDDGDSRKRMLFQWYLLLLGNIYHLCNIKKKKTTSAGEDMKAGVERRVPFEFMACLAHVEITEHMSNGEVSRIVGHFTHNEGCKSALLKWLPAVPLHDHVYEIALDQLENGANITAIQRRNHEMMEKGNYRGMNSFDPKTANVRYHLLPSDHVTLYRKFSRQHGVDIRRKPDEAIFHYSARSSAGERFKVCISTPEMKKVAWKYAHKSQLVLDGTFGICTSRLLLFIALAQDENRKGVPLNFFLFSAPTGNQATHAGYNTEILRELLSRWQEYLSQNSESNMAFVPSVAITDTDTKERGALAQVWVGIILLLCKFHLRQCWKNHRKTAMRCKAIDFWKEHVRRRLQALETIASSEHTAALALIAVERHAFMQLENDTQAAPAVHGGIKHLVYLVDNWMSIAMWQSWSEFGRIRASTLLKIPHLASLLHSGHCLRFDSLIHLLITRVLPEIFKHRKAQADYNDWLVLRFHDQTGGQNLLQLHRDNTKEQVALKNILLCWWSDDAQRDTSAREIISQNWIKFQPRQDCDTYTATCTPSAARQPSVKGILSDYDLSCSHSGLASCSCPNFHTRGGLEQPFIFPSSCAEAEQLLQASQAPPILRPVHWDPVIIQNLGGDTTTLDDDSEALNEEAVKLLHPRPDDFEDSDSSGAELEVDWGQKNLISTSEMENRCAVHEQIQSKVKHEVLFTIQASLNSAIQRSMSVKPPQERLVPTQINTLSLQLGASATPVLKHKERPNLLPPSPEKRQKRKRSHAPL